MTTWQPGMRITAARLNDGLNPVTTSSGLTAATGFSINSFSGYKQGRTTMLDIYLTRTGADLVLASGNLPDTQCATAPVGWRPTNGTINGAWDNGIVGGGFVIGTDGICTLRTSSGTISSTTTLRLHIGFIQD
ncbi:hypothetical protein [Streptomyces sp. NPDC047079]|uniref:hypothetical protein n=1 Tax=Streptomyces sp. NPDC047079 TaxID=3154607 RepID=UPI0033EE70D4